MASKSSGRTRTSYYEVVLCGPHDLIHGLLTGLAIGAGHEATIEYGHERGISDRSLREKLADVFRPGGHECQVILDNTTRGLLKRKARRLALETGVELCSERRISSAEFKFRYVTYAPRYADEIAGLLGGLPKGARLVSHEREEKINPAAKGAEGYTPVHDYEVKGGGEIRGRVDLILDAHEALDRHPLIEVSEIELETV